MWLEVDGKRYQDGSTRTMVFGVAFLVSYLSQFMSLWPGDVISTGTPPGVGPRPEAAGLSPPRPDHPPRHRRPRRADQRTVQG
jgi:2-keto-4-pentenoate hydratase/2-oxohepta-3-ene-1,7-dioic acid hydratase in catechol pathway